MSLHSVHHASQCCLWVLHHWCYSDISGIIQNHLTRKIPKPNPESRVITWMSTIGSSFLKCQRIINISITRPLYYWIHHTSQPSINKMHVIWESVMVTSCLFTPRFLIIGGKPSCQLVTKELFAHDATVHL